MTNLFRGILMLAVVAGGWTSLETAAAEPALVLQTARTRLVFLRKGSPEIVNFGTLADDVTASDRFIVVLIGNGVANLQVSDADQTGDTIRVTGQLQTVVPTTFDQAATSPAKIELPLLVSTLGILTFDVTYDSIVNTAPANYLYRLKF